MAYYNDYPCKYSFSVSREKLVEIQEIVKKYDVRFIGNPYNFTGNNIPITIGGDGKAWQNARNEISLVLQPPALSKSRATKGWVARLIAFIFHTKDQTHDSNP